jgi:hypothetical protein
MSEKSQNRQVRYVEPIDTQLIVGQEIEYSDEVRVCKEPGCNTKLSGYRVRQGHLYCSACFAKARERELYYDDHNNPLWLERRYFDLNMKEYKNGKEMFRTMGKKGVLACMDT